jgi:hypothetical protein
MQANVNAQALASFVEIRNSNDAAIAEAKSEAEDVMEGLKVLLRMAGITAGLYDSAVTLDCNNGPRLTIAQLTMKIEQELRAKTAAAALKI